jgi:hypothetical protein
MEEETGWSYHHHLSVSDGIKVGGYPTWTQDPAWPDCPACGQRVEHLLTLNIDGEAWRTWLAVEDTPATGTIWELPYEERTRNGSVRLRQRRYASSNIRIAAEFFEAS